MKDHFFRLKLLTCGLAMMPLAACSSTEQTPMTSSSEPTAASSRSGDVSAEGLKFEAPASWVQEAPSSSMRLAQYRLPHADGDAEDAQLVVYYFGGSGGSVQANVDRWIGQFTDKDGSPVGDSVQVSEREVNGLHLTIVDVSGTYHEAQGPMMAQTVTKADYRMLAAVAEGPGGPWFFKLTGPQHTVDEWMESFHSFLEALQLNP